MVHRADEPNRLQVLVYDSLPPTFGIIIQSHCHRSPRLKIMFQLTESFFVGAAELKGSDAVQVSSV